MKIPPIASCFRNVLRATIWLSTLLVILLAFQVYAAQAQTSSPPTIIATNYASLQDAVQAAWSLGGTEVYLPAGDYVITETLNLTRNIGSGGGLKLRGAGAGSTRIIPKTHGQPAIDVTGSSRITLTDLNIWAENLTAAEMPNVGILLARRSFDNSAQENQFIRISVDGHFTLANVYNLCSELDRFSGCIFHNEEPNAYNVMWVNENIGNVVSPWRGPLNYVASNTGFRFEGCSFYNLGDGNGANFLLSGTTDLSVRDSYMATSPGGYAVVFTNSPHNRGVDECLFESVRVAAANNSAAVFKVNGWAQRISIHNCTIIFGGSLIDSKGSNISFLNMTENELWRVPGVVSTSVPTIAASYLNNSEIDTTFSRWYGTGPSGVSPSYVLLGHSAANKFRVNRRTELHISDSAANTIEAVNDGGNVSRQYMEDASGSAVLNLSPVNTSLLPSSQKGDIALDDGTNTASGKPGLAVFDGARWVYMN